MYNICYNPCSKGTGRLVVLTSTLAGTLRRGQSVEVRIFLAESHASTLRLLWDKEYDDETLDAARDRDGYMHSITARVRSCDTVKLVRKGRIERTRTGTTTHYDSLAEWKVK